MSLSFFTEILKNVPVKSNIFRNACTNIFENYRKPYRVNVSGHANNTNDILFNQYTEINLTRKNTVSISYYSVRHHHLSTTLQNLQRANESLVLVPFPNPILWMKMKWRFRKLNYFWDPDFKETDFLRGARQAVVTITHLIGENNFDDLKGLLTKEALQKLRQEVTLTWPDVLKQHISLSHQHIKAVTPINVRMMENIKTGKRFCDIDILYIALKRIMFIEKGYHRILVFNILSRFHRNYSDGEIPNWTVAIFTMDVVAHKTTS